VHFIALLAASAKQGANVAGLAALTGNEASMM
jgi:hypothetical protein